MVALGDQPTPTLLLTGEALAQPFVVTFEEAFARLEQLERMFIEPDGAFVWVSRGASATDEQPWQLDGVLYDRGGRLLLVDLKGSCPPAALDQLLSCFDWPATAIAFQITQAAVFLGEAEFRAYAATNERSKAS